MLLDLLQFLFELRVSQILIGAPLLYHTPIRIVGSMLDALEKDRELDIKIPSDAVVHKVVVERLKFQVKFHQS